jgi:N-methylhydantoinase A
MQRMYRLGVDTGGTFTDFVLLDDGGGLRVHKVLSTPHAPEQAILQGIDDLGIAREAVALVHGTTVATNAVLEGKGVRTAYVTNRGFADLLTIGRQRRAALYDLQPPPVAPPVPPELCVEIPARLGADGRLLEPLTAEALAGLAAEIARLRPEAVAVNLLFSYLDPSLEARIAEALPAELFVSLSSQVLPEVREYERGIATFLNAWVGPRVAGYLTRLQAALGSAPVAVMQSTGDTVAAAQAAGQAVRMLLSGPAGGLIAARFLATATGEARLLTFDMGGTSTDVALVDEAPRLTTEGQIGRYPVAVPMVDMHTIGAGGGSIAWLDDGGMLQVGPGSAGADPGPACYGLGGTEATVTDANLVLGRLQADAFLDGGMTLDRAAAERAVGDLAARMGRGPTAAARDIVAVANEHMAQALRAIAIKRGEDPGDQLLVSFGGAGGLHVCALADLLGADRAMVPINGGVLSALGMLAARPGRQLSRTLIGVLDEADVGALEAMLADLRRTGMQSLRDEGHAEADCTAVPSLDLRYAGQAYTLNLPWRGVAATVEDFHRMHQARYGHRLDMRVEIVNLRQWVRGPATHLDLPGLAAGRPAPPVGHCVVEGAARPVPRFERARLVAGQCIDGPALVSEAVATTWLAAGWSAQVDGIGNLLLARSAAQAH